MPTLMTRAVMGWFLVESRTLYVSQALRIILNAA